LRNGINLYAEPNQGDGIIINETWRKKDYTPKNFEIGEDDVIIDIGAHKGYFSTFASFKAKKGKVYSFEPLESNYNILKKNLEINKCINVVPFQLGISGAKGIRKLYISPDSSAGISLVKDWLEDDRRKIDSFRINCITLRDIFSLCHIEKIDFLKIDCEGAEYEILSDASVESLAKISRISMEFHQIRGLKVNTIKNFLKKNGFSVRVKDPENTIGMLYARRKNS
jgi:FkbM family methyltransferase